MKTRRKRLSRRSKAAKRQFKDLTAQELIEWSSKVVGLVERLATLNNNEEEHCPSCGQWLLKTTSKICCLECGSRCNLQDGCESGECTCLPGGDEG